MTQRDPAANQPDISVDTPQAPRKASAVFRKAALQVPRLSGHSRSAAAPDRCNRLYRFCTDRVRAALFPSSFSSNRESPAFHKPAEQVYAGCGHGRKRSKHIFQYLSHRPASGFAKKQSVKRASPFSDAIKSHWEMTMEASSEAINMPAAALSVS